MGFILLQTDKYESIAQLLNLNSAYACNLESMKTCFLIFIFFYTTNLAGQDYPTYRLYALDEFAREHVGDEESFTKQFYQEVRYNAIARENRLEGKFDVQLLNHSDSAFEILMPDKSSPTLKKSLSEALSNMRESWVHLNTPFIVNFCVEYKLVSRNEQHHTLDSGCNFQILGYAIYEKHDTSYIFNSREISIPPRIIGYPTFVNRISILRNYATDSIESFLEAAMKTCCSKSIRLTQMQPPYHSQDNYIEPKGRILVFFHSKGYISKINLYGQLAKKLDADALLKTLQGVRFHPAQTDSKPAHVVLEYRME